MNNPFKAIRQYFQRDKDALEKSYFELEQPVAEQMPLEMEPAEPLETSPPITEVQTFPLPQSGEKPQVKVSKGTLPDWLQDEDAVRDEAVIFGLTDVSIEEKLKTIESFFAEQTAGASKEVELLSERIGEHNLAMERLEKQVAEKQGEIETYARQTPKAHQLPRRVASLFFSLAMAMGNLVLIDFVLKNDFPDRHMPIAVGVFFAGMFSLFSGRSFLQNSEERIDFRRVLQEVLLPLSASFFVFVYVWPQVPVMTSWALLFFVFSLFLFSGKLLLENISVIREDWKIWRENLAILKMQGTGISDLREDIEELEESLDAIRVEKWKIIPELNRVEKELNALLSKKTAIVHLFESEFKLARSYRDKLTRAQIKKIIE
ncbi:hypothetical protein LAG90_07075 [Marinilongibacter aquaticus]|uniref:hypothetical protein n=1 Tax=Marinilongibacter aquaticus TaxID=2975157 RepID=UPI0021BD8949|nr:hypothetical protein [Marinilongibacter aquaticus]UBM60405.1 hypothetical protein LAG90_07075 [Marinilongibacter aquaticus]